MGAPLILARRIVEEGEPGISSLPLVAAPLASDSPEGALLPGPASPALLGTRRASTGTNAPLLRQPMIPSLRQGLPGASVSLPLVAAPVAGELPGAGDNDMAPEMPYPSPFAASRTVLARFAQPTPVSLPAALPGTERESAAVWSEGLGASGEGFLAGIRESPGPLPVPMPTVIHRMAERAPSLLLSPAGPRARPASTETSILQRAVTDEGGGSAPASAPVGEAQGPHGDRGAKQNDVHLLATEVWSLLKRRLQAEAERRGRW